MNQSSDREEHDVLDLERGESARKDGTSCSSTVGQEDGIPGRAWSGFVKFDDSVKVDIPSEVPHASGACGENPASVAVRIGEHPETEKKSVKEKPRKLGCKKPPKPPRPPKGPILDAADQLIVRQIAELAMVKRARVERMKALKRMKANKSQASSSNICAMVITAVFFVVVIFQGVSGVLSQSRPNLNFQGSPVPATRPNFISVKFFSNDSTTNTSESPRVIELQKGGLLAENS